MKAFPTWIIQATIFFWCLVRLSYLPTYVLLTILTYCFRCFDDSGTTTKTDTLCTLCPIMLYSTHDSHINVLLEVGWGGVGQWRSSSLQWGGTIESAGCIVSMVKLVQLQQHMDSSWLHRRKRAAELGFRFLLPSETRKTDDYDFRWNGSRATTAEQISQSVGSEEDYGEYESAV